MNRSISKEFSGRFAGCLYISAGSLLLLYAFIPAFDTVNQALLRRASLAILAVGFLATVFPWRIIPRWIQLSLPLYALVLAVFVPGMVEADPTLGYPFLLLVFVWIAICGNWALVSIFFAVASLSIGLAMGFEDAIDGDQVLIAIDTLFVALVVGLVLSFTMTKLAKAQTRAKSQRVALEVLVMAVEDLAQQVTVESVGAKVGEYAKILTGGLWSSVVLLDVETEVVARFHNGPVDDGPVQDGVVEQWQMPISVWEEISNGAICITGPDEPACWENTQGVGSVIWVPLRSAGSSIGVIAIALKAPPDEVETFVKSISRGLASQAALAFERVHLTLSLLDQSMRDELTGTGNRRHAMALLSRVGPGDGVMVLDLDFFKEVNDSFGHDRGDELLRQLSTYLTETLRDQDAVARYGGDEFLAILWGVDSKAEEVVQRLMEGWRALNPATSMSVGVAIHSSEVSANVTFQHADSALYEAKNRGRDQGVVSRDGGSHNDSTMAVQT